MFKVLKAINQETDRLPGYCYVTDVGNDHLWEMTLLKLSRAITVFMIKIFFRRTSHTGPRLRWQGGREEVEGAEGGGGGGEHRGGRGEWEKLNERDRAKQRVSTPQQNLSNSGASWSLDKTGFSPLLPAWLVSSSSNKSLAAFIFWWRKQRWGGSLPGKMDHLIRSKSRWRTPLFLLALLHVTASQKGKV